MTDKKKKYHKKWGTSSIGKVRRVFRFMRLGMYLARLLKVAKLPTKED